MTLLSQIERMYKKMNEYLYEIAFEGICESDLSDEEISISPDGENLNDEEIMIEVSNRKLHTNRKKRLQKENYIYGKESNYNLYC